MTTPAVLALEDGTVFRGVSVGAKGNTTGEVVFNTSMSGYQEILTDPSYCRQIVTLTYPHIGNTGTTPEDLESGAVYAAGLVIRDLPLLHSNWRSTESLNSFLTRCKVVAIADIDTRKLTRLLREKGAQSGCIMTGENIDESAAVRAAKKFPGLNGMDLAKAVSTKKIYQWNDGAIWKTNTKPPRPQSRVHVVAYDFGIKRNILRILAEHGCRMTVVPAQTPADQVLAMNPDGIFLANWPGDPAPCDYAIAAITNDTIAYNTAELGGGVWFADGITGTLLNVTVAKNPGNGMAGGGTGVVLQNTLVDDNTAGDIDGEASCDHTHSGAGSNMAYPGDPSSPCTSSVIIADGDLGPLQNNGGVTGTLAPPATSPALAKGTGCPETDQRGEPRKSPCTLGAYEVQ